MSMPFRGSYLNLAKSRSQVKGFRVGVDLFVLIGRIPVFETV